MSRTKALGLELVQDHPCVKDKEISIHQRPTDSVKIKGDGNCYLYVYVGVHRFWLIAK